MDKLKILVVDDSDFIRIMMKKFFENYNFEVTVCTTGLQGVKAVSQSIPDIIFTDLVMPGFSGLDFIKSVKVLPGCANIPFVIITAYSKDDLIHEVKKNGVKYIISKPLKSKELFDVMDSILGGHALTKIKAQKLFNKDEDEKEIDTQDEELKKAEIRIQNIKAFLRTFELWIRDIRAGVEVRNQAMLKSVVNDIKQQGSAIGYPRLKMLCEYLESLLDRIQGNQTWKDISTFSEKLIEIMNVIKTENQESNSLDTK